MEYGYCRISTPKQNIERQVRNIEFNYPRAKIIREVFTGTKFQGREKFDLLINKTVRSGDTIIFDSVSRMSRNADEGFNLYMELYDKGVSLVFLKEPHINTEAYNKTKQKQLDIAVSTGSNAMDNLVNTIVGALNEYAVEILKEQIRIAFDQAQKEVDDLHQRTKEGLATARLNGKTLGRPTGSIKETKKSIEAKEKIRKYNINFNGSMSNQDTWNAIGISKMSFYKYKNEMIAADKLEVGAGN